MKSRLLFWTSFPKVKSKYSKNCGRKQANFELSSARTTSTDLEGSWAEMQRIYLHDFMSLLVSIKIGNRSNRALVKNTSEKHIEHESNVFQQKRL